MGKISKKREMLLRYSLGESLISTNANTQDNAVAWKILIELYKKQELVPKELLCYQGMLQAEWLRDGDSWSNEAIDCFFDIINCINECCMPDYIKKIKEGKMEFIYDDYGENEFDVIGIRKVDPSKPDEKNDMGKMSKEREMRLRYVLGESLISANANTKDIAKAWKELMELYKDREMVPMELLSYQGILEAEWHRDGDSWSNEAIDRYFDIVKSIDECCWPGYIKKIEEGTMEFIYDIDLNVIGIREVDQLKTEENNMPRMSKEREALLRYRLADAYFNGHSVFEGDTWEELMELYKNEEMVPKEFLCYLYALNEELNKEGNIWPDEVKNVYYEIVNNVFEYCKPEFMRKIEEREMEFIYDSHYDVIGIREIDFSKTEE